MVLVEFPDLITSIASFVISLVLTTGPLQGYYMYIEASLPRISGDKAILKSPAMSAEGQCTLNFWYTMYGNTIGDLNVHLINETGQFVVSVL